MTADDRKPDDDLMRRLVEAVEAYATQANADRAAKEADQKREANAIGAVVWALFGLAWLVSLQRGSVSHFVTSNWAALPVIISLVGLAAAFAYRAFRLQVFKVAMIYAVAGAAVLAEVYFMVENNDFFVRAVNVFLGYVGLWYFAGGVSDLQDDQVSFQVINDYVKRWRWVSIAVLLLLAVATFWYLLAPMSSTNLGISGSFLIAAVLVVLLQSTWSSIRRSFTRH